MEYIVKRPFPDFTVSFSEREAYVRIRFEPRWRGSNGEHSQILGEALLKEGFSIPGWCYNYPSHTLFKDILIESADLTGKTVHDIVELVANAQTDVCSLMDDAFKQVKIATAWKARNSKVGGQVG